MDPSFRWETAPNGVTVLRTAALPLPHGFSSRLGGVSEAPFAALNLGLSAGDDPEAVRTNRARFGAALGLNAPILTAHQVHGPAVRVAEETFGLPDCRADAVVSAEPWSAVGVFTADCTPILLWDPATGAVGAVHAGWRGTVADVTGEAVRVMAARYGASPEAMVAAIGPAIGPCCFEVGPEVAEAFAEAGLPEAVVPREPKPHVDLWGANFRRLTEAGLAPDNIHRADACTFCDAAHFFSWRRDAGLTGRMLAAIASPGVAR